jgi:hypothetical protein
MTIALALLLILALALPIARRRWWSFQAQSSADLAAKGPAFNLKEHLSGPILCEGLIYGPTGRVTSRFVADMVGEWHGNTGTLRERFHYDSGTVQDRVWTLHLSDDGRIRAEAPDVIGTGTGQAAGAAVQMSYNLKLTPEAGGHVLAVNDWMYLMENGTIMNRSQFSKFGITVAELVATLRKVPA